MYKEIFSIAMPGILAIVSFGIVETINIIFMGHHEDASYLSGVGVGNSYINVFSLVVLSGLNTTLATLVSQTYGVGNL